MGRPKINPVHIKLGAERRLDSDRPQRVDPPLSDRTIALPHRSLHFQPRFTELWEVIGWGVGGWFQMDVVRTASGYSPPRPHRLPSLTTDEGPNLWCYLISPII